jgi:hypothetical protein
VTQAVAAPRSPELVLCRIFVREYNGLEVRDERFGCTCSGGQG